MHNFINEIVGCTDCKYYDNNCETCLDKTTCLVCKDKHILDTETKKCVKCHDSCLLCSIVNV